MAITPFGTAANIADGGSASSDNGSVVVAQAVTPPASMVAGDLVEVITHNAGFGAAQTINVSATGGQTWTSGIVQYAGTGGAPVTCRSHRCIFNGTWGANPSFICAEVVGRCFTVLMDVYRPTSGSSFILTPEVAEAELDLTSVAVCTITGQTPTSANSVTVAWLACQTSVTFSSLSAGWTARGGAQIRNAFGGVPSTTCAYDKIQTSAAATGNVSNTASGTVDAASFIVTFAEAVDATGHPTTKRYGGVPFGRGDRGLFTPRRW